MTKRAWSITGSLLVSVLLVLGPWLIGSNGYQLSQGEYVLSLALVAIGFNLATGYAGQLTLGPGATFLAGAYACAVLANERPAFASLWLMCIVGISSAVLLGLIMALPALRIGGFYFAIVTLFVALVLPEVFSSFSWAGGDQGISLVSNPSFVQTIHGVTLYEVVTAIVLVTVTAVWALMRSKVGRRFFALRAGDELTAAGGVSPYIAKISAFAISSVPAGLGGALYVYSQQFVSPGSADANTSIYLIAACILGGLGTLWGPVIGTVFIFELQLRLGYLQEWLTIVFAILLLVCTLLLPRGVVGLLREVFARFAKHAVQVESLSQVPTMSLLIEPEAQQAEPLTLSARNLVCRFGGVTAVDGVSLEVHSGTIHALIGSNGSGKTTILNAISGFGRMQEGVVAFGGRLLPRGRPARISRLAISRTFQTPKLISGQAAITSVMFAADGHAFSTGLEAMLGVGRGRRAERTVREIALGALDRLGIRGLADLASEALPHGGMRLVEVARVIAAKPTFVLLDEPAAGLTINEMGVLETAIRAMAESGIGVLLVEHNTTFVFRVADEVTVLHQGKVIARGEPEEIARNQEVIAAYLGSSHVSRQTLEAIGRTT